MDVKSKWKKPMQHNAHTVPFYQRRAILCACASLYNAAKHYNALANRALAASGWRA